MDTANLLSTVLSAPAGLPLNERTSALAAEPVFICRLLNRLSTIAFQQRDAARAWDTVMDTLHGAAV
ncbi:hypothetical protein ACIBL6_20460 [Streptomyces sp. NPDC050400]|uniref:hypothetical protein n=1 Tax=Streptomyces sp. NPDC050400 TaxID=3365610 RepID=UPI0037A6086D